MKKYLSKSFGLTWVFIALTYNGCDETRLDLKPGAPTEDIYFSQEIEFERAVYGVYAKLTDFWWYNGSQDNFVSPVILLPGDDITTGGQEEFEQFANIQPGSFRIGYYYTAIFQMIARANVVLEKNLAVAEGIYTTPGLKNIHRGEALFLRAYGYYLLWNIFGTAPLVVNRVKSQEQSTPPSTTGTQLLDQAIVDLEEAVTLLPDSWPESERGRVFKNSARGLQGKCLVFRASVTNSNTDYQQAITVFNTMTGLGTSLVPVFDDNFAADTENNAESLFEYQATQAFEFDNIWLPNDFDNAVGALSVFWGFYSNQFNMFGKARFIGSQKLINSFSADDPRLTLTVDPANGNFRKYVTRDVLNQGGASSVNNPRLLRFADILLLKAEAINESAGSTTEAITLINQVRTRARSMVDGGIEPANRSVAETNRETIRQWIVEERLLELAGEGQRWFDLRRWHLGGKLVLNNNFFSSATPTEMNFNAEKHINFPIPAIETDINPNIIQNPGY